MEEKKTYLIIAFSILEHDSYSYQKWQRPYDVLCRLLKTKINLISINAALMPLLQQTCAHLYFNILIFLSIIIF